MGAERVTIRNLEIVDIKTEQNLLLYKVLFRVVWNIYRDKKG